MLWNERLNEGYRSLVSQATHDDFLAILDEFPQF
jgi:hypothetical protein